MAVNERARVPLPTKEVPLPTNGDLSRVFHEIGDLLEIKGELVFKTVAYHRAADAIAHSPVEIARAYRAGTPPRIAGVGKAISDKIAELATTGRLAFLERLHAEVPPTLTDVLAIPGLGPKTVKLLWERLDIATLDDLRTALDSGALRDAKGITEKGELAIRVGLDGLERRGVRMTLGDAERIVEGIVELLRDTPGLVALTPAGSFRRRRETIGDLDLLAETDDPGAVIERFTSLALVEHVVGAGPHKASVRLVRGPQVDLMTFPPGNAGTYLVHFTGSKDHNVRLRGIARERGWSLSEKGFLRLGEEADLRGDCHAHSDWSDGIHSIDRMAETARARGYAYLVLTDHSHGLAIARGLTPERVLAQREIVRDLNRRFAAEEDAGAAPAATPAEGFRILHGCELEIRADGALDFDDEVLAAFDVVVASLHQGRRQPRAQLTDRVLGAIRSPHVDVIGHPAGRMLGERARDDLDLAWDELFAAAAETGTLLELDGSDHRLDLAPERARRAVEAGCMLTIDSDAHRTEELAGIRWGVAQARRAWVEPAVVANTWSRDALLAWVAAKPDRIR